MYLAYLLELFPERVETQPAWKQLRTSDSKNFQTNLQITWKYDVVCIPADWKWSKLPMHIKNVKLRLVFVNFIFILVRQL